MPPLVFILVDEWPHGNVLWPVPGKKAQNASFYGQTPATSVAVKGACDAGLHAVQPNVRNSACAVQSVGSAVAPAVNPPTDSVTAWGGTRAGHRAPREQEVAQQDAAAQLRLAFEAGNVDSGYVDWYAWLASRTAVREGQLVWNQAQRGGPAAPPRYRCIAVPPTLLERLSKQDRLAVSHFHTTWQRAGVQDFAGCYDAWQTRCPLSPCAVAYFADLAKRSAGEQAPGAAPHAHQSTWLDGTLQLMLQNVRTLEGSWQADVRPRRGRLQLGLAHVGAPDGGQSAPNADGGRGAPDAAATGTSALHPAQAPPTPSQRDGAILDQALHLELAAMMATFLQFCCGMIRLQPSARGLVLCSSLSPASASP